MTPFNNKICKSKGKPGVRYRIVFVVSDTRYLRSILKPIPDTDTWYLEIRYRIPDSWYLNGKSRKYPIPDTRCLSTLFSRNTDTRYRSPIPDTGHRYPKKLAIPDTDTNPWCKLFFFCFLKISSTQITRLLTFSFTPWPKFLIQRPKTQNIFFSPST